MFGYIKLDGYSSKKQRDYFRRNYCFLCRALDKHYGIAARMVVSYDVTFFVCLFSEDNYLSSLGKVSCFKSTKLLKEKLSDEFSKKVAALNLALAAGELKDNIGDKDKFYAKPIYGIYSGIFKKVKKDYPLLWEIVEAGHQEMNRVEDVNGPIEDIENCFASLIERIAREVFNVTNEEKITIIKYIAKMLYFMDAVDDIDKDIKRNTYNALKKFGSKKEYICNSYNELDNHLRSLRQGLNELDNNTQNASVVNRILNFGIPETLTKICFKGVNI